MPPPAGPAILRGMATVRDYLDRVARWYARASLAGLGLALAVDLTDRALGVPGAVMNVGLAGFGVACAAIGWGYFAGVRCPRCGEPLGRYYRRRYFWSTDLRACPGCGLDLDGPDHGWPPVEPD